MSYASLNADRKDVCQGKVIRCRLSTQNDRPFSQKIAHKKKNTGNKKKVAFREQRYVTTNPQGDWMKNEILRSAE